MDTPVGDLYEKGKAWYRSKTIIGIIIAAVSTLIQAFQPEIDLQGAVDEVLNADEVVEAADNLWTSLGQGFGLILAFWGRIKAKFVIKGATE